MNELTATTVAVIVGAALIAAAVVVGAIIVSRAVRDFAGGVRDGLREQAEDVSRAVRDSAPDALTRAREAAEEDARIQKQEKDRVLRAAVNAAQVKTTPDDMMDPVALRGYQRGVREHAEGVNAELKAALPTPEPVALAS